MSFYFKCVSCNAKLEAEDDWEGMDTQCPKCNAEIIVTRENSGNKITKEISSAKKLTDCSIKELTGIFVNATVKLGKKLVRFSIENWNKILYTLEVILITGSIVFIGYAFAGANKTKVSPTGGSGYSSGRTGANAYSSSVSVGDSSYATAQNTSQLLSNTSEIIRHVKNSRDFINHLSIFLKNGITSVILILIAIWLETCRSNLKREINNHSDKF
ncbi:hypothetical protein FYJ85_01180 [Victivallaceae bacterium BBE-744-WT-12]|uniref:Uncharacterized protein n=1 Tax=Victivallis lenta TaxID=2606640 RepID=A0A844FWN0_9BACT|nr:hypothetical protein [Victivallis lenta]MST95660.1 hypothetical protein [Victivallis lenta]